MARIFQFAYRHKIVLILLALGCYQFGQGTYIYAKAAVAQVLVESAWAESQESLSPVKPWSWADTWPVAKLTINGDDLYTLEGADGSTLAFGPGHMPQTPMPGKVGNSVIVGHRDTHFRRLKDLESGDIIQIATHEGEFDYKIREIRIAHETQVNVLEDSPYNLLTLITCYPFDSIEPNPDYRYIVRAEQVSARDNHSSIKEKELEKI